MARPRSELSEILHEYCSKVHFQPPTGTKLSYPCIIYNLENFVITPADNVAYMHYDKYEIIYITRDPDDPIKYSIAQIPMCKLGRVYTSDNLYHYSYTLYF